MTEFDKSYWAKAEFAQGYRENADNTIVERRRLLEVLKSFYRHFMGAKPEPNVLDLGCGDGIVTHELLKINGSISATLIDGSGDMLDKAKERLKDFGKTRFTKASFQEILSRGIALQGFDFAVSSLAIHHLSMDEKANLFGKIYAGLNDGGYFFIIDVILAPTESLEQWYLLLWKEWMGERGIEGDYCDDRIRLYKDRANDKPDTLDSQLSALKSVGFKDVDCFYKYGIFAAYGGRK